MKVVTFQCERCNIPQSQEIEKAKLIFDMDNGCLEISTSCPNPLCECWHIQRVRMKSAEKLLDADIELEVVGL